ncbi:unnamed protein product, partial [Closterium sp. NIES-53]
MENVFDHYDLLEVMEGTEKRHENDSEKSTWVRKSPQGYLLLGQALGSSQIHHIKPFQREPEKGPKAWAALKGVHAPSTVAVAVVLERQTAALRIEEDEAVEEGVQMADICGAIVSISLTDGPLLKAKRLEEQEEGEEEAVEAVAVAEVVLQPSLVKHVTSALGQRAEVKGMGKAMFKGADGKMVGLKN